MSFLSFIATCVTVIDLMLQSPELRSGCGADGPLAAGQPVSGPDSDFESGGQQACMQPLVSSASPPHHTTLCQLGPSRQHQKWCQQGLLCCHTSS